MCKILRFLSLPRESRIGDILSYLKDEDTGIRTSLALPDYPELLMKFLIFLVVVMFKHFFHMLIEKNPNVSLLNVLEWDLVSYFQTRWIPCIGETVWIGKRKSFFLKRPATPCFCCTTIWYASSSRTNERRKFGWVHWRMAKKVIKRQVA